MISMGAFLDKPKTTKTTDKGDGNGLQFGLASMQGWRVEMEDAHCARPKLAEDGSLQKWSFFAVFDGHAGQNISKHCADHLLKSIVDTDEFKLFDESKVEKGILNGFLKLDDEMRQLKEVKDGDDKSGSTAVCVLISPSSFYFANCGDSRAILVRSGKVLYYTTDHKPVNEKEKERIQNAGGNVMIQRVNGSLAVSRSLGDYDYKNTLGKGPTEQMVSPEPEIDKIGRDRGHDEYIVLACDGVWDVMTNEELCEYINHRLKVHENMIDVCKEVLDTCFFKGSRDNMSIVIVKLDACPIVDHNMVELDKKLNDTLKEKVTDCFEQNIPQPHKLSPGSVPVHEVTDINTIFHQLNSEDIKNLPPGGGLASKRAHIESVYEELMMKYTGVSSANPEEETEVANKLPPSDSS